MLDAENNTTFIYVHVQFRPATWIMQLEHFTQYSYTAVDYYTTILIIMYCVGAG